MLFTSAPVPAPVDLTDMPDLALGQRLAATYRRLQIARRDGAVHTVNNLHQSLDVELAGAVRRLKAQA